MTSIALWAIALTILLAWLFNRPLFRSPQLLVAVAKKVGTIDQLETLLQSSVATGVLVAITLKNGKAYVGVPERSSPFEQAASRAWVAIWPMASGYRDVEGKLRLNTFYSPQYERLENGENVSISEKFRVVVPRTEITTAQLFDLEIYASFQGVVPLEGGTADVRQPHLQQSNQERKMNPESKSEIEEITREILDQDDLYRLFSYCLYLAFITLAILVLPVSVIFSALLAAVAFAASIESVENFLAP